MKLLVTTALLLFAAAGFTQVTYVNTSFENASPCQWTADSNNVVTIDLIYDHERASINRANGHWHFQVEGKQGTEVKIILRNFDNIWNGMHGSPVMEKTRSLASADGKTWKRIPTKLTKDTTLELTLHMDNTKMFVASVEPYRISDLDKLVASIKNNPLVKIETIGLTVEGRPLELIRIGRKAGKNPIFLRGRAHPWEAGGNWVIEGLIRSLVGQDCMRYLDKYTIYIMPMANKDGVARGKTRFNAMGMDLNRQWDKEPDSSLVPEKYAFENWLKKMIAQSNKPILAVDLHNDNYGNLHVNLPTEKNKAYVANMNKLESLLRKHTWFTEGKAHVKNPGSLGEGLAARYGIDACVYEFNYDWIAGLQKAPTAEDWINLGSKLREVFYEYVQ